MMAFLRSGRMRHPELIHQDPSLRPTRDSPMAANAWKDLPERRAAALKELASKLDFVSADAVLPELQATTKHEAVRVSRGAIGRGRFDPPRPAGTGRGRGPRTGVPRHNRDRTRHRHPACQASRGAPHGGCPGRRAQGIEYNSVDEEKVHLICLLLSPLDAGTEHLLALQELSRHLANQDYWTCARPSPRYATSYIVATYDIFNVARFKRH